MNNESDVVIELDHVRVSFGDTTAVHDASLKLHKGEILGVIGFSGAGKSTLVRTLNLLQTPSAGRVRVLGTTIYDDGTVIKPRELRALRRRVGMIFQGFNLLNQSSIADNIAFALRHSELSESDIEQRVRHLLELVHLEEYADAYPAQLSGGQKQRVAIARALANNPEVLLSDESTSALDPQTTIQILDLLKDLNRRLGVTVVLITHEMDAVKRICDRIIVMEHSELVERGALRDVVLHPRQAMTREFVGGSSETERSLAAYHLGGLKPNQRLFQLTYGVDNVDQSATLELYRRFGVESSILYGSVDVLNGELIGTLIILVTGDAQQLKQATDYLASMDIDAQQLDSSLVSSDDEGTDADQMSAQDGTGDSSEERVA